MHSLIIDVLISEDMYSLYNDIEMPLVFVLYDMQRFGIRVDKNELDDYSKVLTEKINVLEKEIYELAGEEFNINSPKQLGVILFEKMGMPNGKKTKSGYSTAADILDKLAPDYPIVKKILEYRQLAKLNSTYAVGLTAYIKEDGRIHGTFNQTITATGRISVQTLIFRIYQYEWRWERRYERYSFQKTAMCLLMLIIHRLS